MSYWESYVLNQLKQTVGYAESDNQTEFLKGARQAVMYLEPKMKEEIEYQQRTVISLKKQLEEIKAALIIVNKFTSE